MDFITDIAESSFRYSQRELPVSGSPPRRPAHPTFALDRLEQFVGRPLNVWAGSSFGGVHQQLPRGEPVVTFKELPGKIVREGSIRLEQGFHPAHGAAFRGDRVGEWRGPVHTQSHDRDLRPGHGEIVQHGLAVIALPTERPAQRLLRREGSSSLFVKQIKVGNPA